MVVAINIAMELIAPARMLVILALDLRPERRRHTPMRACVLGDLPLQRAERVGLAAREVVHPLDRLVGEANRLARRRMLPRRGSKLADSAAQVAGLRRRGQQL